MYIIGVTTREDTYMQNEELKEIFSKDFEDTLNKFKSINAHMGIEGLGNCIQNANKRKDDVYQAFKELAEMKVCHGNEVPLVMAYYLADNAAHMTLKTIIGGLSENMEYSAVHAKAMADLYHTYIVPFCMLMWDSLQNELIDKELENLK